MSLRQQLRGTGVALITPFGPDFSIDYDAFGKVIDHVINGGVEYVVALGTTGETPTLSKAEKVLSKAQKTAQGRARIALAAALGDLPGWFDPLSKEPASTDYAAQEKNQYDWLSQIDFPFAFYRCRAAQKLI